MIGKWEAWEVGELDEGARKAQTSRYKKNKCCGCDADKLTVVIAVHGVFENCRENKS